MRGDRAGEAEIIQRRRPQAIDDAAQVGDGLRGGVLGLAEQRAEIASAGTAPAGVTGAGPRGVEVQPDAGQQRTEPVVQIAAQPTAFFLRALTSRCRESSRSAVSASACTAAPACRAMSASTARSHGSNVSSPRRGHATSVPTVRPW